MDRSERVGYLVLEATLIAAGVVLALAADSWWADRQADTRAGNAMAAISAEMRRNRAALAPLIAYHDSLMSDMGRAPEAETWDDVLPGYFRGLPTPRLSSGNWSAAISTGALDAAPDSMMAELTDTYALQDWVLSFGDDLRIPLLRAFAEPLPSEAALNMIVFSLNDLLHQERLLYERLREGGGLHR